MQRTAQAHHYHQYNPTACEVYKAYVVGQRPKKHWVERVPDLVVEIMKERLPAFLRYPVGCQSGQVNQSN